MQHHPIPNAAADGGGGTGAEKAGEHKAHPDHLQRQPVIRQFELTEKVHSYAPEADTGPIDATSRR